ncbi:MAG: Gfo/Idh/MocA family oxidoreductase [Spirochaetales bacterium]|nr:Gfo/Idh/MocA family oxidoreductase [Spirochaetales bacterium]
MAVHVAVIGVGDFGVRHVKLLREHAGAEVTAVCRRDEAKVKEIAREFDVPVWSTDAREILHDPVVDAVVIATSEETHYSLTREAVARGKHVLLEKPVCLDPDEGRQLIELAAATDRIVLPGHVLRYDAAYCEVKRRVASGELGDILSVTVKRNVPRRRFALHSRTHPVFMALAHDIDIILWLTGRLPRRVYAVERRSRPTDENPDIFFGLLEMDGGIVCRVETQWTVPDEYGRYLDVELEVMATDGHVKLQYPGDAVTGVSKGALSSPDVALWPEVHGITRGALAHQTDSFIRLIDGSAGAQVVTVKEAVQGIAIGHALIQSASQRREIRPDFSVSPGREE